MSVIMIAAHTIFIDNKDSYVASWLLECGIGILVSLRIRIVEAMHASLHMK